ncbi:MAG: hypothetical protein JWN28_206 [Candidatus Saccharibacteria bacterium]|nr:hypothetical protein [Candidatus Saccharibacteria bacterium]
MESTEFSSQRKNLNINGLFIGGGLPLKGNTDPTESIPLLDASLELAKVSKPNLLIVSSARWSNKASTEETLVNFQNYFEYRGLSTKSLHPFLGFDKSERESATEPLPIIDETQVPETEELSERISEADLIYVLGGDANRMLNTAWRPLGIDTMLKNAAERGTVFTGNSAGCLAWFEYGLSASTSLSAEYEQKDYNKFKLVKGLGWVANTICSPHYDQLIHGRSREDALISVIKDRERVNEIGMGIDNDVALQIINGNEGSVVRGPGSGRRSIHSLRFTNHGVATEELTPDSGTFALSSLFNSADNSSL